MPSDWKNKLFFGDNLPILKQQIADESVDLVYLDPPFNSNANYSVLFKEKKTNRPGCSENGPLTER
jgi:site-specific DNA-methyltransferase (adenine-specific)